MEILGSEELLRGTAKIKSENRHERKQYFFNTLDGPLGFWLTKEQIAVVMQKINRPGDGPAESEAE
jgi:hypothetical protein